MNFDTFPTDLLDLIYDYKYQLEVSEKKDKVIKELIEISPSFYCISCHMCHREYCNRCGNYMIKENIKHLSGLRLWCNCGEASGSFSFFAIRFRRYYNDFYNYNNDNKPTFRFN